MKETRMEVGVVFLSLLLIALAIILLYFGVKLLIFALRGLYMNCRRVTGIPRF